MSYVLETDETVGEGLARVIHEQVEWLERGCSSGGMETETFVHKARVRCKRIRAVLRLARGVLGEDVYRRENAFWRDAARGMSHVRDMSARIEALDAMGEALDEEIGAAAAGRLAARFYRERAAYAKQAGPADPVAGFCAAVAAHDTDLRRHLEGGGLSDIAEALGGSYARARRAMRRADKKRTPELFHEWRKQAKYHALQVRLSRRVFPSLASRVAGTRELGELLGAVQDIEVVMQGLAPRATRMRDALEARRLDMVGEAFRAGGALYGQKPREWLASALDLAPAPADL